MVLLYIFSGFSDFSNFLVLVLVASLGVGVELLDELLLVDAFTFPSLSFNLGVFIVRRDTL